MILDVIAVLVVIAVVVLLALMLIMIDGLLKCIIVILAGTGAFVIFILALKRVVDKFF